MNETWLKQRMFIHEVICPPISGVIAHALNRSYCHGALVYAMINCNFPPSTDHCL